MTMDLDEKLYYLCRLEISKVDAADAGTYKAVAKNNFGEGFATINLTFEEGNDFCFWGILWLTTLNVIYLKLECKFVTGIFFSIQATLSKFQLQMLLVFRRLSQYLWKTLLALNFI